MIKIIPFTLALFLCLGANAFAFCEDPTAPDAPYFDLPEPPDCGYESMKNCNEDEIENYRSELERYVSLLEDYNLQIQEYAADASRHAQCLADEALEAWNDFSGK